MTALAKYHSLKEIKYVLSQFYQLEIWSQGVSRAVLSLRLWVESFLSSSYFWWWLSILADPQLSGTSLPSPPSSLTGILFPLSLSPLLIRHQSFWIKYSSYSSLTSPQLITSKVTLFPKGLHSENLGVRMSCGEGHNLTITALKEIWS